MSLSTLSARELRRAADITERIDSLQAELNKILSNGVSTPDTKTEAPKKREFSAASRAKMRRAQKARWAKIKGIAPKAESVKKARRKLSAAAAIANIRAGVAKRMAAQGKPKKKGERKMSAAGRAAISAAAKARWAKAKAAGRKSLKTLA